jgi:integrase
MSASNTPRVPAYRLHKARGCAVVTFNGKNHYLGTYGSPESRAKYNRLIAEYVSGGLDRKGGGGSPYPVAKLCDEFLNWAKREYRTRSGEATRSVDNARQALRTLFEMFADLDAAQFGPRSLLLYRDELVRHNLARTTVNDRVKLVRRAFKWATENERVPPSVFHGLQAVSGLRRGRGGARETEPVHPAPEKDILAALPFMPDPVRAMVELQLLTGARPSEILLMRAAEINRSGRMWLYEPSAHKNAWRGRERLVFIGPKGQEIIRGFLRPGMQERYLFSPTIAELRRRDRLRAARKTPLYPSHLRALERKRKAAPKRKPRDHYDVTSYRQAITRACKRARVPAWRPNQLRHNAATRLRAEFGLDVAKAVLGHSRVETTQIYAEVDRLRAMEAMEKTG